MSKPTDSSAAAPIGLQLKGEVESSEWLKRREFEEEAT